MRYELIVRAFDVMDQIHVSVVAAGQEDLVAEGSSWTTLAVGTLQGTGEDDIRKWARDVLHWATEAL